MKKKLALFLIILGLFFWGTHIYQEQKYKELLIQIPDASKKSQVREFKVEKGDTVRDVATTLAQNKLIVDSEAFVRFLRDEKLDKNIKAGIYYLNPGMTIGEVSDVLLGKVAPALIRVTIPEGYTIRDIATLLEEKDLGTSEDFLECAQTTCDFSKEFTFLPKETAYPKSKLEGYLYPDTYFLAKTSYTPKLLIGKMLENFRNRVVYGLKDDLEKSDKTLDEIVIMGSILEKESRPADNQEIVAGLLWKRIENNVQLAADATTRYIKEDPTSPLTMVELTSTNPYNTRKSKGLTPTAISNPGLSSIKAAMHPEDSEYWYYLHDGNGQIHFAATEAEHGKNKRLYIGN